MSRPSLAEQHRDRIAHGLRRYHARRMALARIAPAELRELERTGSVSARLRPFVAQAAQEAVDFAEALGGVDQVSPQRMAILRDTARLGALLSALLANAMQRDVLDLDEVAKITSLASARRANLSAIGLERHARDVEPDLRSYLAARSGNGAGHEIDAEAVHEDVLEGEGPAEGAAPAATVDDASDSDGRV